MDNADFPAWDSLITPEQVLAALGMETSPRPAGLPTHGLTKNLRVVVLLDLSPRDWDRLEIRKVTGLMEHGWTTWHRIEPSDRERVLEQRKCLLDEKCRSRPRNGVGPRRRPPRVRRRG
jgi:hypothetical protein